MKESIVANVKELERLVMAGNVSRTSRKRILKSLEEKLERQLDELAKLKKEETNNGKIAAIQKKFNLVRADQVIVLKELHRGYLK